MDELKNRPSPNFGYSENQIKTLNPKCWEWDGVGVGEVRGFLNCLHGKKRQPTLVKGIYPLHQSNHYGHHKQCCQSKNHLHIGLLELNPSDSGFTQKGGEGRVL